MLSIERAKTEQRWLDIIQIVREHLEFTPDQLWYKIEHKSGEWYHKLYIDDGKRIIHMYVHEDQIIRRSIYEVVSFIIGYYHSERREG